MDPRLHPQLLAPFDALERQKSNLLSQLAALDPAQQTFQPDATSWSVAQVVDHLARSEEEVVKILRKGLPESRHKRSLKDRLAYHLVLGFMASPLRVKAPLRSIVPPPEATAEVAARHWDAARAELLAELEKIDDVETPVIAHPVAGPADARQTIRFLAAHVGHHLRQVQRIRRHRDFPATA